MRRRTFIMGAAGAAVLRGMCGEGSSDAGSESADQRRFCGAVAPPGARSVARLTSRCSACGLCISACPGRTLRAAGLFSYGLAGMMMPRLDFANGYCSPDCHRCAEVCPAKAIEKAQSAEERARIRVGIAEWRRSECITVKEGSSCGLCAGRCPKKAISMVKGDGDEFARPVVNPDCCVGCGKCEYYCPAKPKAIVVRGLAVHESASGGES